MVRGRYRVGVSKTKTKEKIMMKKKVMPLSCLMAAAMLAGCGTAAPAVPEETTAPAVETAEAAQETAPADAAESEAAAVEKTAGVWQVEPCYNFDEIVPLYSEWDHTAGKNAADGLYAVRDGERWSLFSTKTGNIMMQDAAQQMPYLYGTNELSVWLDDEYYNYDNFAAMREKCEGLNAELQANGAEISRPRTPPTPARLPTPPLSSRSRSRSPQTKPPIWPPSPSNRLSPQEDCCRRGQQPSFFFFKFFCRPFNFSARRPYRVDVRKNKT